MRTVKRKGLVTMNKKQTIKKLLQLKKRMHIFAIEFNPLADVAPLVVKINGIEIKFDNLDILSSLKYWKDSKSALQAIFDAIKDAYEKAE